MQTKSFIVRNLSIFCFLFFGSMSSQAQNDSLEIKQSISLDRSVLSGIGLKKIDLKDAPEKEFYQKNLFYGEDISVYVVSSESWLNTCKNYPFDEFVYMFHGAAKVSSTKGIKHVFHSGDFFFAHRGFNGLWEILAEDKLHYELSVISTKRRDSTSVIPDQMHQLFSKEMISGLSLNNDSLNQKKPLVIGSELQSFLHIEQPNQRKINKQSGDVLIHVLSGKIQIHDQAGKLQSYFTGDFFVLPKGFKGMWTAEGHSLVKYLSVERSF